MIGRAMAAVGVLAVGLGLPAGAQGGRRHGSGPYYRGTVPFQHLDPAYATPQALLERDFQYMRATSPTARGAQPSPVWPHQPPRAVSPPLHVYPPSYYYGGYPYYGYPYGYGYYPYGPQVYQREVIILREPLPQEPGSGGLRAAPAPRPEAPPDRRDGRPAEDFYLKAGEGESISDALDDIRKAWLNGDFERLRARFVEGGQVRVYPKGAYRYSVAAKEFVTLLKDAMTRIDTLAFEVERPKSEEPGRVFVAGKHVFLDGEKKRQETHVSYGLERIDGKWKIVEVGSSSSPISRHERP